MNNVAAFFTPESVGTLAVATGLVWAGTNTFRLLLKRESLWIAFTLSLLAAFLGAVATKALTKPGTTLDLAIILIVTFFNGCLLFCTAMGVQTAASPTPPPGPQPAAARGPRWLGPWKVPRI